MKYNATKRGRAVAVAGLEGELASNIPETETPLHAGSRRARDLRNWLPPRFSPDAAFIRDADLINARVEDLTRNNGIAKGARRTLVDNAIGPRITCKPTPDRIMLGFNPERMDEYRQLCARIEAEWASFADTTWFDAGERHTFHSMTRLAMASFGSNGEVLALPQWIRGNGRGNNSRWFTRIQMIHTSRLSTPTYMTEGPRLRGGVEMNEYGAPTAYWIRKTHPGDWRVDGGLPSSIPEWERIPATQNWGRVRVIHLYDQEEVGQSRGVSPLTAVLRQFKMFDRYSTEELRQAVISSLIFAAIETPLDSESLQDIFSDGEGTAMQNYYDQIESFPVHMQGGQMVPLPPGTKMNPFNPTRPNSGMDAFSTIILRHIGTALGVPYELIFKDFSKSNYSSARAALLEAWRYFDSTRQLFIDHWIRPIYDLWFEEAVQRGRVPGVTPEDYYGSQVAWTRAKWLFAPRGWIDPLKEAQAIKVRMEAGITTLQSVAGENGEDWEDILVQKAVENQVAEDLGLPKVHRDPEAAVAAAGETPEDEEEPVNKTAGAK